MNVESGAPLEESLVSLGLGFLSSRDLFRSFMHLAVLTLLESRRKGALRISLSPPGAPQRV